MASVVACLLYAVHDSRRSDAFAFNPLGVGLHRTSRRHFAVSSIRSLVQPRYALRDRYTTVTTPRTAATIRLWARSRMACRNWLGLSIGLSPCRLRPRSPSHPGRCVGERYALLHPIIHLQRAVLSSEFERCVSRRLTSACSWQGRALSAAAAALYTANEVARRLPRAPSQLMRRSLDGAEWDRRAGLDLEVGLADRTADR